jgi:TonB-linked SusC/RagA family outer membrane protein
MVQLKFRKIKGVYSSFGIAFLALSIVHIMSVADMVAQNTIRKDTLLTVSGMVRDAKTKLPITAAKIILLNRKASAITDDKGLFVIKVASRGEVLSVSAFDYGTRDISIRGNDSVVVDLYPAIFSSPYKKVETLTGMVDNTNLAKSASSIDQISASPYITIDNEIQTGLGGNVRSITRSGTTGVGVSLFVDGLNSINANAQPLYIVDGAIMENSYDMVSLHSGFYINPLATIDVSDIESVTLIKNGTSIYGSKAANGVIVIKTNHPSSMVTKITAKGFIGVTTQPKSIPVMDASQFRIFVSDLLKGSDYATNIDNYYFLMDDPSKSYYKKYHNKTNWDDLIYRNGITQGYSLGVNGGDERSLYQFSIGFSKDQGELKGTDMQRFNARFNADINFSEKINLEWNIGYTNMNRNLLDDGVNYLTSPSFLSLIKAPFFRPNQYTVNGELNSDYEDADEFGVGNPLAIIENSLNTNKQYRFNIGVTPSYRINAHWVIKNQFDYSLFDVRENFYRPMNGGATVIYPSGLISKNEVRNQQSLNISIFNNAQLVYDRNFGNAHHIGGIIGWRYVNNRYKMDYGIGINTQSDSYRNLGDAAVGYTSGLDNKYNMVSTYANVDYSYKNKYMLSVAADMDASSRFGSETDGGFNFLGTQWGLFPSVNVAWLISSERFMKNVRFINLLKLRAGYGITGNDDIDPYVYKSYFVSENYMSKALGLVIGNLANNKIQWETTYKKSAGFDLSILNERVTISGDIYRSITKNLLVKKDYTDITGLGKYWCNSGEMSNNGFEITTNFKVLNLKDFKWEWGMSAGHYKNNVESLPNGQIITDVYGGQVLTSVGNPAAVFYGYKTKGIYSTAAEASTDNLKVIDAYGNTSYFGAGDVRFVDTKQDGIINDNDKQVIGDPNPDVYGSVTSRVSFKSFMLDILFTYSYGNDVYNYLRQQLEGGSGLYNQSVTMLNRWRSEGQQTSQPKAVYGDPMGNSRFSDRWIEDGSYIKMKALTLNYKLPIKNTIINGVTFWVSANNLFVISKYLGRDPECSASNSVFYQGVDAGFMPNNRSYFVGLKLDL